MDVYNATGEPQQGASRDGALPTGDLLGFTDQLHSRSSMEWINGSHRAAEPSLP